MTRTVSSRIAVIAAFALLGACSQEAAPPSAADGTRADWRAEVPEIRIGISGTERDTERMSQLDAYTDHISKRLGVPVSFFQASDYAGVVQAIAAKQIELAITGAAAYAAMDEASGGNVEPLVTNRESDGSTGYYAALFVRADGPYRSLDDLRGHTIAYADVNSTSGYLFPRFEMRKRGIDPDTYFSESVFAGGHPQAVISVVNGQYDAGFTWVSGLGDPATGFTRGNLRGMIDAGQLDMSKLRVIGLFGPMPNGPTVIRSDLPQELKDLLRGILCAMPFEAPQIFNAVTEGEGGGYIAVPKSFYQVVFDMRDQEREARRAE